MRPRLKSRVEGGERSNGIGGYAMFGYLIDLEGVLHRGPQLIPGAAQFIERLKARDIPFLLLTNASLPSRREVASQLEDLGIQAGEEHVFTCAMATARYLALQKPGGSAFVIGEGGLLKALERNGYRVVQERPDFVVVGEGRLRFEMVEAAIEMVANGARLIATHLDPRTPATPESKASSGAVVAMLESATGVKAFSVGKPSPIMMRGARKQLGLSASQTIVIGDSMTEDILGGVQLGYKTVLTLSGVTCPDEVARHAFQPDKVVASIAELDHDLLVEEFTAEQLPIPQGSELMPLSR
jgi:NagD protein